MLFDVQRFTFTGSFLSGTRKACERAVCERRRRCLPYVRGDTDFVVIRTLSAPGRLYSTHRRHIEAAVALQDAGTPLKIS